MMQGSIEVAKQTPAQKSELHRAEHHMPLAALYEGLCRAHPFTDVTIASDPVAPGGGEGGGGESLIKDLATDFRRLQAHLGLLLTTCYEL